jgi:hypothetical protein
MRARQIIVMLAVVTVICVGITFLLHLGSGPFSVTHGPATALRAKRTAFLLAFSMLVAALLTASRGYICYPTLVGVTKVLKASLPGSQTSILVRPLLC